MCRARLRFPRRATSHTIPDHCGHPRRAGPSATCLCSSSSHFRSKPMSVLCLLARCALRWSVYFSPAFLGLGPVQPSSNDVESFAGRADAPTFLEGPAANARPTRIPVSYSRSTAPPFARPVYVLLHAIRLCLAYPILLLIGRRPDRDAHREENHLDAPRRAPARTRWPGRALLAAPPETPGSVSVAPAPRAPEHPPASVPTPDRVGERRWEANGGGNGRNSGLNVLVITSEAPPVVSGISRAVDRLATGLRQRGHQVDVLSSTQIPR